MDERETSQKNSHRFLGEDKREYVKQRLDAIAFAKSVIREVNEIANKRINLSEICADIIEQEQRIIQNEIERIKVEHHG